MSDRPAEGKSIRLEEPPPEEPGMLMTSMIDVIFILLAFFVCVSELRKGKLHVDVPEVPAPDRQVAEASQKPLVIEVTADDRVFVGGREAADVGALDQLLAGSAAEVGTDVPVHLSGDREAKNGTMMRVVSSLSRAGFKRIEFAVQAGG